MDLKYGDVKIVALLVISNFYIPLNVLSQEPLVIFNLFVMYIDLCIHLQCFDSLIFKKIVTILICRVLVNSLTTVY